MDTIGAIFLSVSRDAPARPITLPADEASARQAITQLTKSSQAERATYDEDCIIRVDAAGADNQPDNPRITYYIFNQSQAAARFPPGAVSIPPYCLHGAVVITGDEERGVLNDAPARLFQHWGIQNREGDAAAKDDAAAHSRDSAADFPARKSFSSARTERTGRSNVVPPSGPGTRKGPQR